MRYFKNYSMRTTITMDNEAYEAARTLARTSGRQLGQIISELIRRALQTPESGPRKGKKRFANFNLPSSAKRISLRAAREGWENE